MLFPPGPATDVTSNMICSYIAIHKMLSLTLVSPRPVCSYIRFFLQMAVPKQVARVALLLIGCQLLMIFCYFVWSMQQKDYVWDRSHLCSVQRTSPIDPTTDYSSVSLSASMPSVHTESEGALKVEHRTQHHGLSKNDSSGTAEMPSHRKQANMTVGILVARRERPIIYYLLDHLLREPHVAEDFIIIVHVAFSVSQDEELLRYLQRLKDVVVTVVEENPYPEAMIKNIADTQGDSMERTVWRTTHGEA